MRKLALALLVALLPSLAWGQATCDNYQSLITSMSPSVYMRLGELSGTTAVNVPGTPNGTWETTGGQNGTSLIAGDSDKSFFDGHNQTSITYPNDTRTAMVDGWTALIWVKGTGDTGTDPIPIWSNWSGGATHDLWGINIQAPGGQARCYVNDNSAATNYFAEGAAIDNGSTHLVVCRYSSATGICVNVDGNAKVCNTTPVFVPDSGQTDGLQVNCYVATNSTCVNTDHNFDEPAYFKSRLTDQNITDIWQAGSVGCQTATATPASTATNTPTPTSTLTPTPTSTPTPTFTPTVTPTAASARRKNRRPYMRTH